MPGYRGLAGMLRIFKFRAALRTVMTAPRNIISATAALYIVSSGLVFYHISGVRYRRVYRFFEFGTEVRNLPPEFYDVFVSGRGDRNPRLGIIELVEDLRDFF